MDDQLMKEFVGIVTEELKDVHLKGNKIIRENSDEVFDIEHDPVITPYGIIITTMRFIIDDGEDLYDSDN